mgnify:CR=1 FL=1
MSEIVEETGTLTSKGQTTVPKTVRQMLGLASGDVVTWRIVDGAVTVTKGDREEADPAIAAFLKLLERDIAAGRNVHDLPQDLTETLQELAEGDADPAEFIDGETVI